MNKFTVLMAAVSMTAISAMAVRPGEPTNFSMTFDINGGNPVMRGQITAPTHDGSYSNPQELTTIDKIYIVRGNYTLGESDEPVYTILNPVPGQTYTFVDECEEPLQIGYDYSYTARAVVGAEEGYGAYCSAYYGIKPAAPTVSVATEVNGALPLTVTMTAPTQDNKGNELTVPLTKLSIYHFISYGNEVLEHEIANPVPGQTYTYQNSVAEEGSIYRYRVYAECAYGKSEYGGEEAYVGADKPAAPTNFTATVSNGQVVLTWTAPTTGRNNGWIDPAATRYRISRFMGGEELQLIDNADGTTFTDACEDLTRVTKMYYTITPYNASGNGDPATSAEVVAGPPAILPFVENFNNQVSSGWYVNYAAENMWTSEKTGWASDWTVTSYDYSSPYNGGVDTDEFSTDGMLKYNGAYADPGYSEWYRSSDINLSDASYPVVSLYYGAMTKYAGLEVSLVYGDNQIILADFSVNDILPTTGDDGQPEAMWVKKILPVEDLNGLTLAGLQVRAHMDEGNDFANVLVDKIVVDDYPYVATPTAATEGASTTITWEPANNGRLTADAYEVTVNDAEPVRTENTSYTFATTQGNAYNVGVRAIYGDIPSKNVMMSFVAGATGIDAITVDGSRVEYFTFDGLRVARPTAGMILIRRTTDANGHVTNAKVKF